MATHSSVLAWRIPGTAEPGGLPSMGSHRVGHNWSDLAAAADVFLECSCFFDDPTDVSNLISGSSAFSKTSVNIWKFTVHNCWSLAWIILSITLLACEISAIVWLSILWHCLFLGTEVKTDFSSPVVTAAFSKFAGILWNNRLVPNKKRSMSRLYIVTLLI